MTSKTSTTEADLVARAQLAVSSCNWEVGECAAVWTSRFAKGRTDSDFALLVGLSADQVYQRRRVWETFADVYSNYPGLKWSHFYSALNWEDAADCLQWAEEIGASVAEMKAWRRAQHGEDLTQPAEDEIPWDLPVETATVRSPQAAGVGLLTNGGREHRADGDREPVAAGVARISDSDYAPFNPDAVTAPSRRGSEETEPPTPAAILKRMISALERCAASMTKDFTSEFSNLKEKDRKRFWKALETLQERADDLR